MPANDYLATMAWDVAASGILLFLGSIFLRYDRLTGLIEGDSKQLKKGFAIVFGLLSFYLFMSGVQISFIWPFTFSGGVYNVLFGGIATMGGLLLLAGSIAMFFNGNLKPISYFATAIGAYGIVDAYAIVKYGLTNAPLLSALGYLSFAAPALLSVFAAHSENRLWKRLFQIFTMLFAAAWLVQAVSFTLMHLQPP